MKTFRDKELLYEAWIEQQRNYLEEMRNPTKDICDSEEEEHMVDLRTEPVQPPLTRVECEKEKIENWNKYSNRPK